MLLLTLKKQDFVQIFCCWKLCLIILDPELEPELEPEPETEPEAKLFQSRNLNQNPIKSLRFHNTVSNTCSSTNRSVADPSRFRCFSVNQNLKKKNIERKEFLLQTKWYSFLQERKSRRCLQPPDAKSWSGSTDLTDYVVRNEDPIRVQIYYSESE